MIIILITATPHFNDNKIKVFHKIRSHLISGSPPPTLNFCSDYEHFLSKHVTYLNIIGAGPEI